MSSDSTSTEQFISASPAMQDMYKTITRLMGNDLTVTITGESGTGKALMARMLHQLSTRKTEPFITLGVASTPPQLMAQALFGADGKAAQAGAGTLFLEDVDALPPEIQTSLLQLLQQGEYCPEGGAQMLPVRFRLICATSKNLMQLMRAGLLGEDLYYRLNVIPLRMPPLRARKEDIAPLANYFLKRASASGLPPRILEEQTIAAMQDYAWPGNVRELENMMHRFCTIYPDSIIDHRSFIEEIRLDSAAAKPGNKDTTLEQDVEAHLRHYFAAHSEGNLPPPGLYDRILPLLEKPLIEMTLRATGGNQLKTAFVLGINRNTLRKKMGQLKIDAGEFA